MEKAKKQGNTPARTSKFRSHLFVVLNRKSKDVFIYTTEIAMISDSRNPALNMPRSTYQYKKTRFTSYPFKVGKCTIYFLKIYSTKELREDYFYNQ